MGFKTVAISRGRDKESLAYKLGAHEYVDAEATEPAKELKRMGGAKVILCTAPNAQAISGAIGGLGRNGQAVIVAAGREPLQIPAGLLIGAGRSIVGSGAGEPGDAINFSVLTKVIPMVESLPSGASRPGLREDDVREGPLQVGPEDVKPARQGGSSSKRSRSRAFTIPYSSPRGDGFRRHGGTIHG